MGKVKRGKEPISLFPFSLSPLAPYCCPPTARSLLARLSLQPFLKIFLGHDL